MEIRLIKYFLTIAEEENITKAAEKLHMSQPPLSRQLKLLEDELGVTLFERGKKKMQLTKEGYYLKSRGKEIIELIEQTEMHLKEIKKGVRGTINIGTIETAGMGVLPNWIAEFQKQFPDVKYSIGSGNSDEITEKLNKGLIDIGIIREPFNEEMYEYVNLEEESWVALVNEEHKFAKEAGETISLNQIGREPIIIPSRAAMGVEINKWFASIGRKPNIFCVYGTLMNAIVLVERNTAIAICPSSVKNVIKGKNLITKVIINPKQKSKAVVVWKKYQYMSSACQRFLQYIKEVNY